MILEARREHCFSSRHLLLLDDRPVGAFEGHWLREGQSISLRGVGPLEFTNRAVFGSDFWLIDYETEHPLAQAVPAGWFTSSWNLDLSIGPCRLESEGLFSNAMVINHQQRTIGRVADRGFCEHGWHVTSRTLTLEDLLMVGLLFAAIQRRRQQQATN